MRVSSFEINHFRNISSLKLDFEAAGAVIFGKNGTGKTNLLEAIAYGAFGKSIRSASDSDLVGFSKAFFRLVGEYILHEQKVEISAAFDKKQKIIKLDENRLSKISELFQYVKVVYFSPEDIELISGAPAQRRRFMNQAIAQTSYQYLEDYRHYYRILKQRNALLKSKFSFQEKRVWDQRLVKTGAAIIEQRLRFLDDFIPNLCEKYLFVSGEREQLSVAYKFSFPVDINSSLAEQYAEHLERIENEEIRLQRTLAGPHLDDLNFLIEERSARDFGSQGQKRSLAITSRLVQADLIKKNDQETPILMFDDVLADLDPIRAHKIMQLLGAEHQIFIATPNRELYRDFALPTIDLEKCLDEKQ
ncbi:MAG: DNA replication and repair protein RecF [Candidatus Cloacimonadales bacterium]